MKPEFWSSLSVSRLSLRARLIFIGVWNIADDSGRGVWEPKLVKASLFPMDSVADRQVSKAMQELVSACLVRTYSYQGKPLFEVSNWEEHQKIPPTRRQPSRYPSAADCLHEGSQTATPMQQPVAGKGREGNGREQGTGKGMEGIAPTTLAQTNGRPRDPVWDVLVECYGSPSASGRGAMNAAAKTLRNYPAEPDDIRLVIEALAGTDRDWAVTTPTALAKHFGERDALVAQVQARSSGSRALAQAQELERRGL